MIIMMLLRSTIITQRYLAHEVRDDTVEGRSLVAVSLLAGAQGAEVLTGLGDDVAPQL